MSPWLSPLVLSLSLLSAVTVQAQEAAESDESGETEILARINGMRNAAGAPALERDQRLDAAARTHSADMAWHGMLSHVSPRTGSPSDRVRATGLEPQVLGENVAQGADALDAHRSLVGSDAHRANMLNERFTHVGISVVPGEDGVYVTEVFAALEVPEEDVAAEEPEPPTRSAPGPVAPWTGDDASAEAPPSERGPAASAPAPAGAPGFQAPPATGERRVAGYWVHANGRWWYYPLPPDARPGQQLQPSPNVQGPPPGHHHAPGYRVQPYARGYRPGYRVYAAPRPPPLGWSPRRRYWHWRAY